MAWMLEQEPTQEPDDSHSDTRLMTITEGIG